MRYSLLNRFRGAFFGSALGDILSSVGNKNLQNRGLPKELAFSQWGKIARSGAESAIACGRVDLQDWVGRSGELQKLLLSSNKIKVSSGEVAVAMLPVLLFSHDNEIILRARLTQVLASWQLSSETIEDVLVLGYAIAHALTEQLNPKTLLPQTLGYFSNASTPLLDQLGQVQILLAQNASLETTLSQLSRKSPQTTLPIALAFYCFLSTPEDFRLSVIRAAKTSTRSQVTTALTGMLSGVYNSYSSIPPSWRISFNHTDQEQMLQLGDSLLAVWSGVYHATGVNQCHLSAVAAPHVMLPS